ncbi:MAG: DUF1800 domain-containing protein [Terracidiphilus sp.]|jgi:uncharacterized protein (DUF1800 family)
MERLRESLAVLLCLILSIPSASVLAETAPPPANQTTNHSPARPAYQAGQLRGDQRILHALNRFTFGPRPGDLEAVRAMGLEKWFARQLHPEALDQSDLAARLAQFPAMQWSPQDLLFRLPSNAVIRQAADGKGPIPEGGALHAVYVNEIARYQVRQQQKEQQKQQQASLSANAAMPSPSMNAHAESGQSMNGDAARMALEPPQPNPAQPDSAQMIMIPAAEARPEQPTPDEAQIARILALPPQQRVARLATMQQPDYDSFRKALKPPQRAALAAGLTPAQKEVVAALENPQRVVNEELAAQRLTRDIYSNAQLQEVMTDFWLNHFNVYLHKNDETPYYLVSYERDVIRPRALGKFEDLLEATAHSPAMLLYLDNSSSMGPDSPAAERNKLKEARNPGNQKKAPEGLNENYARELMELHTLGVNGGYTQADVTQVARVFTGWTVDRPQRGGGFKFDDNRHEPGAKKVLGKKIKEHGEQEGRQLLHMLATRPATARFLSRKLAVRFAGDDPPQSLVDRMAKSYLSSGGDISAVLTTLFHSPEFWSTNAYRAKVKTPIEFVVSAARAGNAATDNLQPLVNALREMGMPLYGSVPPTGYNWQSSTWVSTGALVNRMNFALALAANKLPGVSVTWTAQQDGSYMPAGIVSSSAAEEQRLESLLVAGGISDSTRAALLEQFQAQSAQNAAPVIPVLASAKPITPAQAAAALEKQDQLLAGLLLGSPEFQRR